MAGSRLFKIGTIFTRVNGLLKSEAMSARDKPLWYDVYESFPPKVEPSFDRQEPTDQIKQILYSEDVIRAKFYDNFANIETINLKENSRPTMCQIFIDEYLKQQKEMPAIESDELFANVTHTLTNRGIKLVPKKMSAFT